MIDVVARETHFADHVASVFLALPPEARGRAIARTPIVEQRFAALGVDSARPDGRRPILASSWADLRYARILGRQKVALMEHGAGQSYGGRRFAACNGSYAGGRDRPASLFLHPGDHPAARDRAAYPDAQVEVVGAPILDTLPARQPGSGPVVACAFHFDLGLVPETRSSFRWIRSELRRVAEHRRILGHAHPRVFDQLVNWYTKAGIEPVRDFIDVCRHADVLIADNTSVLFAFAATDRPVVVLNPPWYDRSIDHGLRFWDAASVGVQVNDPAELDEAIDRALADPPDQRQARDAALDLVYRYRSGAAARAAAVLLEWARA